MGCIAGGIAQAFYKDIPSVIILIARKILPEEFLTIIEEFTVYKINGRLLLDNIINCMLSSNKINIISKKKQYNCLLVGICFLDKGRKQR